MNTTLSCPDRVASRHARRAVVEVLLISAVVLVYRQIRFLSRNDTGAALSNAHRVVGFERRFHIFSERRLQALVMHSDVVVECLNRYYVAVHFSLTTIFLVWVYVRHQEAYRRTRNWFVSVTLAALAIHVAFPLAPPRMIVDAGFVDTLQRYGPRIYSTDTTQSVANQFAAMPSLHFGWALMVACAFIGIKRSRRSLLALLHPAITLLAIVATANHYWIDAGVALALVVIAAITLHVHCRACPTSWPLPMSTGSTTGRPRSSGTSIAVTSTRSSTGRT